MLWVGFLLIVLNIPGIFNWKASKYEYLTKSHKKLTNTACLPLRTSDDVMGVFHGCLGYHLKWQSSSATF
ncbi:CLUMA_CG020810, isoform A [Clunio marinus]|uniref:CLUMA_CG020810, isoform A n=1 Tax=Clunio marinus TaxID=568069 RepID=A0A1J1J632_9DIPT|nr:CLUMA_CG020810, isoform A [Clunio marinus]